MVLGLTGHIDQERVATSLGRLALPRVAALHQRTRCRRKEAALAVDFTQIVLGADKRVLSAQALGLTTDIVSIGWNDPSHPFPGHTKDALQAIGSLGSVQRAHAASQEGVRGPTGAPEHGGHVGAGAHGPKVLVPFLLGDVLGLVGLKKDIGRRAHDIGPRGGGEVDGPGLARAQDVATLTRQGRQGTALVDR